MDLTIPVLFLLSLFAALLPASVGFQCYVCSWSPKDPTNRTDVCSDGHFRKKEVYEHQCDVGCESYVSWDKNGVIEQSRRNCLDSATPLTESCISEENKVHSWKRCTCIGDLCNHAVTTFRPPSPFWLLSAALLLLTGLPHI